MENLRIEKKNRALVAMLEGEMTLDVTSSIRERLSAAMQKGGFDCLVLDLEQVGFIDSSGIGLLVSLSSQIEGDEKSFYLYRPGQQVARTLELVQLKKYFKVLQTEDELAPLTL